VHAAPPSPHSNSGGASEEGKFLFLLLLNLQVRVSVSFASLSYPWTLRGLQGKVWGRKASLVVGMAGGRLGALTVVVWWRQLDQIWAGEFHDYPHYLANLPSTPRRGGGSGGGESR